MQQDWERTHRFVLRLWAEELDKGQVEWRGWVQHLPDGEWCYFRDWAGLVAFLQATLPGIHDGER